MNHMSYDHLAKFRLDELKVAETTHWIVAVRGKQITLGSCVILPKRAIPSLPDADPAEMSDLAVAAKWFEDATRREFEAEKFNYVAAMMKDPFLHFHAFPRYSGVRSAFGEEWIDREWPKVVSFDAVASDKDYLSEIRVTLAGR